MTDHHGNAYCHLQSKVGWEESVNILETHALVGPHTYSEGSKLIQEAHYSTTQTQRYLENIYNLTLQSGKSGTGSCVSSVFPGAVARGTL